jgi:hypothetical protein
MKNMTSTSLSSYLRSFRYGGPLNPERDWFVLLGIALLVLLASIAWNVWFFISLAHGESATPAITTPHTTSSASSVTNIQEIFQARATEQNNYQQTYHFVDPSLSGS